MKTRWSIVTLCIGVLAICAHSAAFPTKDEYVVIADNDQKSTVPNDTTEKPREPIKLTEMRVRSEIALRYARTSVVTHVQNPDKRAQEVTFRMLLPDTAFISGFTMILSGKSYKAYVKEKEEAKQIYTQAVSQGIGAAHVATKARDSNHFTVSTNVEGNTTAIFDLRYEEFLIRRNGVYNHAINLHPGAFVPKMEVVVHIKESQKITKLRVPAVRTGNEIDATEADAQNSKAVIDRSTNDKEATVTFTPDLAEQRKLAQLYAEKTKEKSSAEKYIGYSSTEEEDDDDATGLGQFVVQYDVERSNKGEILVNDGYFVHFLAPTSLPPLNKYVIFVLDTSGSMMGTKIVQLRGAMDAILSDLKLTDSFSIVEFNSDVKVHELKEADEEPPPKHSYYSYFNSRNTPVTLVPPSLATAENIAKAKVIVSRLNASGGTNIHSALEVALNLINKATQKENEHNIGTTIATIEKTKISDKEPMVIFLTDGDPTVGETSTSRIISSITEKNSGDNKCSIFSLAFGEDADRSFLRKLSLRNEGFMRHIYDASDAALQLLDFYRQVSSPLLSHVQFTYPERQIKEGSVSRNKFRTINAGSEVAIVGQIADGITELTPEVHAFCGNEDGVGRKRYEVSQKVTVSNTKNEYLPLERLWAYLTIKQLLDKKDASEDSSNDDSVEKKALAIALKYEFVTPLTSLVVVKPEETNAVDVESVDKTAHDSGLAFLPIMGPASASRPNNAYLISNYAHPSLPGLPGPAQYGGQPLALDAALFPDRFTLQLEDEEDNVLSMPSRTVALFSSSRSRTTYRLPMPVMGGPYDRRNLGALGYDNNVRGEKGDVPSFYDSGRRNLGVLNFDNNVRGEKGDVPSFYDSGPFGSSGGGYGGLAASHDYSAGLSGPPAYHSHYAPNVHATTTPVPFYTYLTTEAPSRLAAYHLEDYGWSEVLLGLIEDALKLYINGTEVVLELTKDDTPPKEDNGDIQCSNSTSTVDSNLNSVCVYLTRCYAARSITAEEYEKSYCIVNNRYAGVCCPSKAVDRNI